MADPLPLNMTSADATVGLVNAAKAFNQTTTITPTQVLCLDGITANIQTQLNNRLTTYGTGYLYGIYFSTTGSPRVDDVNMWVTDDVGLPNGGTRINGLLKPAADFEFDNILGVTRVKTIPSNTTTTDTLAVNQAWVNTYFATKADPIFTGTITANETTIGGVSNNVVINDEGIELFGLAKIKKVPMEIYSQIASITIANTSVETTLLSGSIESRTIPANRLSPGDVIIYEAMGVMSALNNHKAQVFFKIGGVDLIQGSQLVVSPVGALSNDLFVNRFYAKVITEGPTGTIQVIGYTMIHSGIGITTPYMRQINPAPVAINTTIANVIDSTYKWETESASDSITMQMVHVEIG